MFLQWQQSGVPLSEEAKKECLKVVQCFHKFGLLIIKDPRVNE
jgi:hypothetical protein